MKILAIQPFLGGYTINPYAGGKNKVALRLAQHLVKNGHEVYVLPWWGECIFNQTRFRLAEGGAYATALPTIHSPTVTELIGALPLLFFGTGLPRQPQKRLRVFVQKVVFDKETALRKAMDTVKPDLVHVHQTHSDFASVYRKLGFRRPLILTHHSFGISSSLNDYDYVVFVSNFQRDLSCRNNPSLIGSSKLIYNFADEEYLIPVTPKESGEIVFIGSLTSDHKGLDILLAAYAIDRDLNQWRLTVIGDGTLRTKYQQLVSEHNLNVRFVGRLTHGDNAKIMSESSLFVTPSRGEGGVALVYIEALCMGLPIIGYPPNVRELSEKLDIKVGFPFDASTNNHLQLASLIKQTMNNESGFDIAHRREMLRRARESFSIERFATEYMKLYEVVVASAGRLKH